MTYHYLIRESRQSHSAELFTGPYHDKGHAWGSRHNLDLTKSDLANYQFYLGEVTLDSCSPLPSILGVI